MTGLRTYVADLPEAGKPAGRCPECGPHGNAGWVDLSVWRRHVVPCLECEARANAAGRADAHRALGELTAQICAEGCQPTDDWTIIVDPLGEHAWARRVTVEVPYEHGRARPREVSAADAARDYRRLMGFCP